jgi:hypothetical protein
MNQVPNQSRYGEAEHGSAVCYLCGRPLTGKVSLDHVPPRQFFPKSHRQMRSPNLLTLPAHGECNRSFQADEDYFFAALAGLNEHAQIHAWLMQDIQRKTRRSEAKGLRKSVLAEFSPSMSGIHLPNGLVAKGFDRKRVQRVVWKIVRGLSYHHFQIIVPEDAQYCVQIRQIQDSPPGIYKRYLSYTPPHGAYPEVFVYQFAKANGQGSFSALWALFFWESIVAIIPVLPDESTGDNIGMVSQE